MTLIELGGGAAKRVEEEGTVLAKWSGNKGERHETLWCPEERERENKQNLSLSLLFTHCRLLTCHKRWVLVGKQEAWCRLPRRLRHNSVFITASPSWEPDWFNDKDMDYLACRSLKDKAGQRQAPHDVEQTFKDCGRLILIKIPFVAFGGVGGLALDLLVLLLHSLQQRHPKTVEAPCELRNRIQM